MATLTRVRISGCLNIRKRKSAARTDGTKTDETARGHALKGSDNASTVRTRPLDEPPKPKGLVTSSPQYHGCPVALRATCHYGRNTNKAAPGGAHESVQRAFGAIPRIVKPNTNSQAATTTEEDDCKSSIPRFRRFAAIFDIASGRSDAIPNSPGRLTMATMHAAGPRGSNEFYANHSFYFLKPRPPPR